MHHRLLVGLRAIAGSRRLRYLALWTAGMWLLLVLWRVVFALRFGPLSPPAGEGELSAAFLLGLRFDLRLAVVLVLPLGLWLGLLPQRWSPLGRPGLRRVAAVWAGLCCLVVHLVHAVDLGHYAYLEQRGNAASLRLFADFDNALTMVWQSYPVVWGLVGLLAGGALGAWLEVLLARQTVARPDGLPPTRRGVRLVGGLLALLLAAAAAWGNAAHYPLRWSQAYSSSNRYVVALGLNPLLFFCDTLGRREADFDRAAARAAIPLMSARLGLAGVPEEPAYLRHVAARPDRAARPWRVVVILLETQAAHWMGSHGNPLSPTPHLDRLLAEGLHWRCAYVPAYGTARSIWAFFTGLPDVVGSQTASRDPLIADQHSLVTALSGDRTYVLGGSANWANIRGFLQHSIPGLGFIEEGDHDQADRVDVWGVSDLAVLEAAAARLDALPADRGAFVFVQTAGNHRPYTIPSRNAGFERRSVGEAELTAAGFSSLEQFNSVRLIDHFVGRWAEALRASPHRDRTVVVLFGDHGTNSPQTPCMGADFALNLVQYHVPIGIWAPGLGLDPQVIDTPASLLDVLPTLAALLGVEHLNTALGQDLLDPALDPDRGVFVMDDDGATRRLHLIDRRFCVRVDARTRAATLHDLRSATPEADVSAGQAERCALLRARTLAFYETARWLLHHNPARPHRPPEPASDRRR